MAHSVFLQLFDVTDTFEHMATHLHTPAIPFTNAACPLRDKVAGGRI